MATTEWYGDDPGALEPWARAKLAGAPLPTVLPSGDSIDVEKVAAQRPDLIVGIDSAMTRQQYEQLSQIAPTIAPPEGTIDFGTSWQQHLQMVGDALGKPAEAKRLQTQVEDQIKQVAADHPDWRGKEAVNATTDSDGFYVYGPKTANSQLLAQLGFAFPARAERRRRRGGVRRLPLGRTRRPPRPRPDPLGLRNPRRPPRDRVEADLLEAPRPPRGARGLRAGELTAL